MNLRDTEECVHAPFYKAIFISRDLDARDHEAFEETYSPYKSPTAPVQKLFADAVQNRKRWAKMGE